LAAPLRQKGEFIGMLNARRIDVRPFSATQIKLLETFADQAVIAIENVRLLQALQLRTQELVRSVGELKPLGEVGQAVSSTLDLETVVTRIVSHAVQLSRHGRRSDLRIRRAGGRVSAARHRPYGGRFDFRFTSEPSSFGRRSRRSHRVGPRADSDS
jgi:GAF domain-containing protein